ncbi:MAG: hypothetical protein HY270_09870 [Deltaproteobacteria bacterium]|nr:hypothetical protein [Deltaproteobacteria bacterium]
MNTKALMIATAAAGLFLTGAVSAQAADDMAGETVPCVGINACKGQGACHTVNNSCAGQNGCKGQGVSKVSAADCKAKGGKVREDKK